MIYKIFSKKSGRYWLYEFANKKEAVKYARDAIKSQYYNEVDESVFPFVRDFVRREMFDLSLVKFKKCEI